MNIDYTIIILAVISLMGTIITSVLVPYLKNKKGLDEIKIIMEYVKTAVAGAEQLLKIEDPSGDIRKAYVVQKLNSIGLKLTSEQLDMFIEAAVKELNLAENALLQ